MVDLLNDVLGTDVEPTYEPIPLRNYVHDACADCSKMRAATGWERIDFEEGVERVCEPSLSSDGRKRNRELE